MGRRNHWRKHLGGNTTTVHHSNPEHAAASRLPPKENSLQIGQGDLLDDSNMSVTFHHLAGDSCPPTTSEVAPTLKIHGHTWVCLFLLPLLRGLKGNQEESLPFLGGSWEPNAPKLKGWKYIPLVRTSWLPWFPTRFIRGTYPFWVVGCGFTGRLQLAAPRATTAPTEARGCAPWRAGAAPRPPWRCSRSARRPPAAAARPPLCDALCDKFQSQPAL